MVALAHGAKSMRAMAPIGGAMPICRRWMFQGCWVGCAALLLVVAADRAGFAQTPMWRDGLVSSEQQQLDDWREESRRQQQRDRVRVDRVRDLNEAERGWVWTGRDASRAEAPLILFPEAPSSRRPNR
jgi:hypothetical protein